MDYLNKKIQTLSPSATLAVKSKATLLKQQGKTVYDLSAGEPHIDTPSFIKDEMKSSLDKGLTKYTAVPGIINLRAAISGQFKSQGIESAPENVVITNGGKQALTQTMLVTLDQADEVIIPAPYWVSYPEMVKLADGVPVIVQTKAKDSFILKPEDLKSAITPKTKMLILNSPSNPTGFSYTKSELEQIAKIVIEHKILVISDEVYGKLNYSDTKYTSFASISKGLTPYVITVDSFSKTYSMTGWRVGFLNAPVQIAKSIAKIQGQLTSNVNTMSQYSALKAITSNDNFLDALKTEYKSRLIKYGKAINDINGLSVKVPDAAFYLFINATELLTSLNLKNTTELADILIEKGLAVVPGAAFGMDKYFRISISVNTDNLENGIKILASLES